MSAETCVLFTDLHRCRRVAIGVWCLWLLWMPTLCAQTENTPSPVTPNVPTAKTLLSDSQGAFTGRIGDWKLTASDGETWRIDCFFSTEQAGASDLHLQLIARDDNQGAYARTQNFNLIVKMGKPGMTLTPAMETLLKELLARIRTNEAGLSPLAHRPATPAPRGPPSPETSPTDLAPLQLPDGAPPWLTPDRWRPLDTAERTLAWLFMLGLLAAVIALPLQNRKDWQSLGRRVQIGLIGLALFGLILRLMIPHRFVMAYSGYALIEQALDIVQLKRYGAGAPVLYHSLIALLPGGGAWLLTINTWLGWATTLIAAAWLRRYTLRPGSGLAMLALLALHPLLLKDHNSESNLIPALFAFFVGLWHWEQARRKNTWTAFLFAVAAFGFTTVSRPLFLFFVPLSLSLLEFFRLPNKRPVVSARRLWLSTAGLFLLLLPHLAYLAVFWAIEGEQNQISGIGYILSGVLKFITPHNLFLRPDATPIVYPLFWLAAWLWAPVTERRRLVGLLLVSCVFFAPYFVDMTPPSLPRLHVPAAYFLCAVAALGLLEGWRRQTQAPKIWRHPALWVAIWILSLLPPAFNLWRPTNPDHEHQALEQAIAHLPDAPVVLARLEAEDDPQVWGLFYDYPDYLLPSQVRTMGLDAWLNAARRGSVDQSSYIYLGMRCYTLLHDSLTGAGQSPSEAGRDYLHPACQRVRRSIQLEPVWEWEAPNAEPEGAFHWYPPRATLTVGLYRAAGLMGQTLPKPTP